MRILKPMSRYDPKIETVIDGLLSKANSSNTELQIVPTFDECDSRCADSVIVQNIETNSFGIVCVNVSEYEDEPICFFMFNGKLFDYCRSEGFDKSSMLTSFPDKVLKKVSMDAFISFVLDTSEDK